ncbi:patatin-like phospholipase family protein [Sphingosinicella sp. BN140058]|uniref:patatin-like phospholipase family protein n=1 Tax=Sphingosinicella sp. BN140058 TaxID=1892855 RepID=UPI0010105419|nr:patatin-like phospholipase family protein [Sphingosinicella sp. BN140058]QAY79225.1 RpoH suppressor [Sphingosinicella sp. BN140058]
MRAQGPTRYCDLVMKGGITSGIVYPNAVLALSRDFRFKNIGGTSAGAIAAAATAAAGVGDRKKVTGASLSGEPEQAGFEGLGQVASTLATEGFIASLFQPAAGLRSAYRALVVVAGPSGAARKSLAVLCAVFATAPAETLGLLGLFLAAGYGIGGREGLLGAMVPALLCAYLGGAIFALLRLARVARRNLLGLCSGLGRPRSSPALTQWLHQVLQQLSGKPMAEPLTFGDLWNADRYPDEPVTARAITLQMITTGISHHEPRTLPFETGGFWFRRDQFDRLFPSELVAWMVERAGPPDRVDGIDYHRLPTGADMPVLVAMRMSLSFPLLLSAVPLHEVAARDRSRPVQQAAGSADAEKTLLASTDRLTTSGDAPVTRITAMRVCWFSDGGITSNFPLHLFDAPLPLWPTFAINLVYPEGDRTTAGVGAASERKAIEDAVFLPTENNQGWQRTYRPIARTLAAGEISRFLFAIIATMQNWRDLLQSRAPGQRDRIVHIALDRSEGGMNLAMPQEVLTRISAKGSRAGELLYDFSFDNHYWIRWRNLASALQRYTIQIAESDAGGPTIAAYRAAYSLPRSGSGEPPSYKFRTRERRIASEQLFENLVEQGENWKARGPDLTADAPRPLPQMRIAPTY